jgi:tetratricopeptide (TPR) repeat protein
MGGAQRHGSALTASALPLMHFFDHRFRLDGLALLEEALDSKAAREDAKLEALLTATAAHLQYRLDRYEEAEAGALRALEASESGGDFETRMQCYKVLGGCCLRTGRLAESKRWFKLASRHASNPATAAGMLDNIAIVEKALGHYDEALALSQQALLRYRAIGSHAGEALCLNNLGTLLVDRREHDAARVHLTDSLALCERHGLENTRVMVMANLMELEIKTGDFEAAKRYAGSALETAELTGTTGLAAWIRIHVARLSAREGDLPSARAQLAKGMEQAISIGRRDLQFAGLCSFVDLLLAQGEDEAGRAVMSFCCAQPDIPAGDRDEMRAKLRGSTRPALPWPGLTVDQLAHRVVLEHESAYAPFIAALGGRVPAVSAR